MILAFFLILIMIFASAPFVWCGAVLGFGFFFLFFPFFWTSQGLRLVLLVLLTLLGAAVRSLRRWCQALVLSVRRIALSWFILSCARRATDGFMNLRTQDLDSRASRLRLDELVVQLSSSGTLISCAPHCPHLRTKTLTFFFVDLRQRMKWPSFMGWLRCWNVCSLNCVEVDLVILGIASR